MLTSSDLFDPKRSQFETLFGKEPSLDALFSLIKTLPVFSKKGGILSPLPKEVVLKNRESITILDNVTIGPFTTIEGPCFIGSNSFLGPCSYVRPYTYLDEGVVVGHGTEVKESVLLCGSKAAHRNYVGNSILGAGVNLGSGSVCANLRFDHQPVKIKNYGDVNISIDSKRKKVGAILGDDVQVSCNFVVNPGLIVPKGRYLFLKKGGTLANVKN